MRKRRFLCALLVSSLLLGCIPASVQAEPGVSAKAAILIEANSGKILYQKNAQQKLPMASTTKIMTSLIALESGNLDEWFTVDENAIKVEGSSMGLQAGDQVTMRTLAYGMLLQSGNDAANAVAVKLAGSAEAFAEKMNERAQQIGMANSHFVTPSGLDNEEHYSTAEDMAKLARTALQNDGFREICSTYQTKLEYGNPPYTRWMTNHNRLLKEYEGTIGVKTGFTKKSGRCLVSAAERDGVRLIAVTLNAPSDWSDHKAMFDYGFSVVQPVKLDCDFSAISIDVVGGTQEKLGVVPLEQPQAGVLSEDVGSIEKRIHLNSFYYAPIKAGDVVGKAEYWLGDECLATVTLLANGDSERYITEIKLGFGDRCKLFFKGIGDQIAGWLSHPFG